jgi:hypothetical protein
MVRDVVKKQCHPEEESIDDVSKGDTAFLTPPHHDTIRLLFSPKNGRITILW